MIDPFSATLLILAGVVLMFLALALISVIVSEWWEPADRLVPVALVVAVPCFIACVGMLIGTAFR